MATLLSVNNYYYYRGGAETVFLEQNAMFTANGWDVVPFAMHHPKNLESPWSSYFVDEIEFGADYSLLQKIVRVPKVIYSLEARDKISRLIDRVKPDVCHAHNLYNHISPSILGMLRARGIPAFLTLHDLKIACPAYNMLSHDGICERCKGGRLHNVLVHRCVKNSATLSAVVMLEAVLHRALNTYRRNVDRFIVPSKFYISKLVEWGMPEGMFTHVPNFVDVSSHRPDFTPGDAFLYFGRLSREKGIATLIKAVAAARCRLTVVGTGPQTDELKQLALEIGADVDFRGYMTGEPLRETVRQARAVVLPSEWYENAPMTILEAYAMGKPVVGARIGGIPELVREGETGAGFESGNVDSLAAALAKLTSSTAGDIESMGRAGRAWVEQDFTSQRYFERILSAYREKGVAVPPDAGALEDQQGRAVV